MAIFFFYQCKIHLTSFEAFYGVQFSGIKSIYNVVQPSPLSNSRTFYHPNRNPVPIKQPLPILPSSKVLATTNLLSVSVDELILDISYQ